MAGGSPRRLSGLASGLALAVRPVGAAETSPSTARRPTALAWCPSTRRNCAC